MKIHSNCYNQLFNGSVKLLVDEKEAKDNLLEMQKGQKMSFEERISYMQPYKNTTLLVNEVSNLKINSNNVNMKLEMINTSAEKDTFSALEYALWVIGIKESEYYAKKRRQNRKISDMMMVN